MAYALLKPDKPFEITLVADETADDSDKTVHTVAAKTVSQLLWLWIELTSTATVGNRQLEVQILDGSDDVVARFLVGAVQAASLTRYYLLASGVADMAAFRDTDYLTTPLPPNVYLPEGYDIRVFDNNAVDAAADDMIVQAMILTQVA